MEWGLVLLCVLVGLGEVGLCRMFAMSPNPGGGTCSGTMVPSMEVSGLGLEVASGLEL